MIYYNVIKRKSPKDGTVKFYASAQNGTYMNLEQVATNISRECTVTVHDVKAVLSSLQEQIILALQDGKSVRFGDLGSFHATVRSKGAENKSDFKKANISHVMVRFVKSAAMRSAFALTNQDIKLSGVDETEKSGSGSGGSQVDPNA